MEKLFSYGTLQQANVQLSTFGRLLNGSADTLPGYIVGELVITDPAVLAVSGKAIHPILRFTGKPTDRVNGSVFELSAEELIQADSYEVADYQRQVATLGSGITAWIYAAAKNTASCD
jgi:gamma-glutamylcyclotransferase (GGCT)/AIG2-like uncharacterized protein YtfP